MAPTVVQTVRFRISLRGGVWVAPQAPAVLTQQGSETLIPTKSTRAHPKARRIIGREKTEAARPGWGLTSTNGYARLWCEPTRCGVWLAHDVHITYELPGDELPVVGTELEGLLLDAQRMRELLSALRGWLVQPLYALRATPFELYVDLGRQGHGSLKLDFGPRDDVITGAGSTACLLGIEASAFSAQLAFATDPTSLGMLAAGLERALLEPTL